MNRTQLAAFGLGLMLVAGVAAGQEAVHFQGGAVPLTGELSLDFDGDGTPELTFPAVTGCGEGGGGARVIAAAHAGVASVVVMVGGTPVATALRPQETIDGTETYAPDAWLRYCTPQGEAGPLAADGSLLMGVRFTNGGLTRYAWVEVTHFYSGRFAASQGAYMPDGSGIWPGQGGWWNWCGVGADFNLDGDVGTDADIEAFFACLRGRCCDFCGSPDFNGDGDYGTDADIESFFRVLAGSC